MRRSLLVLLIAGTIGHWRTPVRPPPSVIGTAVYAIRVEGRPLIIRRLPDGDCEVIFGGVHELPADSAIYCVF